MSALSTVLRGSGPAPESPASCESRVLEAIARFHSEHRYGPSNMDLRLATGLTICNVRTALKNLAASGFILANAGEPRTLRVATADERHRMRRTAWADVLAKLSRDELRAVRDALAPLVAAPLPEEVTP